MKNKMKHLIVAALIAIFFLAISPTVVYSSPILDQAQENDNGGSTYSANRSLAQTFTAGYSSTLSSVEVRMDSWGTLSFPTTVSIMNTVNGLPDAVLGSVSYPNGFRFGWQSIDLVSEDIFLFLGNTYAIVFSSDSDSGLQANGFEVNWLNAEHTVSYPDYLGGELLEDRGSGWSPVIHNSLGGDMAFRTYVTPIPEPGTLTLLSTAGVFLYLSRKKNSAMPKRIRKTANQSSELTA